MPGAPPDDPRTLAGFLYDRHGAALYRYALMLTTRHDVAADVVHDVFRAVLTNGVTPEQAGPYLWRAVRNRAYSALRSRRTRGEVPLEPLLVAALPAPASDPALRLALERALCELPVEQREVVHLHAFEGHTFQEIADAAAISINTVAARYRYGLSHLRRALGPGHDARPDPGRTEP